MHLGLGETYFSQARSALQKDFNGKAVDYVIKAITVLARCEKFCLDHHSRSTCTLHIHQFV